MLVPVVVSSLVAIVAIVALPAQRVVLELRGTPADAFGAAVAGVGDVDLDGWPDILVGAPDANQGAGYAEVRSGRDGHTLLGVQGNASGDRVGHAVGRPGDVDRDGRPDLLVLTAREALVVGASGVLLWRLPGWRACGAGDADGDGHADIAVARPGGANGTEFAFISGRTGLDVARFDVPLQESVVAMDGVGDADGDGRDDLAVGMVRGSGTAGRAWVLSAARGTPVWEWSSSIGSGYVLGQSVAGVGDFDADGYADVAVGVYETSLVAPIRRTGGEVVIYSGRTGASLHTLSGLFWTDRYVSLLVYFRRYGQALAGGGDLDGDGTLDLLAAEASTVAPTRIRSSTGRRVVPATGAFAFAGDLDRDGFDEVIVGDPAQGTVRVVAGPGASIVAEGVWFQPPPIGALLRMRGIADQDGDGVRDVIVARRDGSQLQGLVTSAVVLSGRDGASLGARSGPTTIPYEGSLGVLGDLDGDGREDWAIGWYGAVGGFVEVVRSQLGVLRLTGSHSSFGAALAGGADWNGDGSRDVFVGVDQANAGSGAVEVRSGLDGAFLFALAGSGGGFGRALCMPGDVDGDGRGDLLVAAPTEAGTGVLRMFVAAGASVAWSIPSAAEVLVALPDQNGDGRPDLALLVPATGQLEVRSGATGTLLRTVVAAGLLPAAVDAGADVDGDGVVDFVVGDPTLAAARVVSGTTGIALRDWPCYPDGAGAHVAWVGDVAGVTQVAVGSRNGGTYATGSVLLRRDDRGHARVARFGLGCRTTLPAPDLTLSARPVLGSTPQLVMRALAVGAPTAIVLGVSDTALGGVPLPLALGAFGIPACVLWTSLEVALPLSPGASFLQVPWTLPADANLIGARIFLQLAQVDATVGLTLRMSAGVRVVLGR